MLKAVIISFLFLGLSISAKGQVENSIPIEFKNSRTYITIQVGPLRIPNILLDTGFAFDGLMLFNPAYRDSLDTGIIRDVQIGGAGDGEGSNAWMIDSIGFSAGGINMMNSPVIILQKNTGFSSNGIIGYSIFGHFVTEIDYVKNVMILHIDKMIPDSSWTPIPLYFKNNNIPWLNASVVIKDENPIPVSMYIDYAAGDAIVLLEKSDIKFSLPEDTTHVLVGKGLSGDIYGKTGTISKIIIGAFELNNVKATFAIAQTRSKQQNADAILGNGSFSQFNLIFDYAGSMLYLKLNGIAEPFKINKLE